MFTGLIDDIGRVESVAETSEGREVRIACRYEDLDDGESVAVDGACLTVLSHGPRWLVVAAVATTLERTTIGSWSAGRRVNLERAMRLGGRLGGHLVQGHVDAVGRVTRVQPVVDARVIDLALPDGLTELMVQHGSLAVDGVSLTVNDLPSHDVVQISLIPYTMVRTTLGSLAVGDGVHVEADMLGKYVQRLLEPWDT